MSAITWAQLTEWQQKVLKAVADGIFYYPYGKTKAQLAWDELCHDLYLIDSKDDKDYLTDAGRAVLSQASASANGAAGEAFKPTEIDVAQYVVGGYEKKVNDHECIVRNSNGVPIIHRSSDAWGHYNLAYYFDGELYRGNLYKGDEILTVEWLTPQPATAKPEAVGGAGDMEYISIWGLLKNYVKDCEVANTSDHELKQDELHIYTMWQRKGQFVAVIVNVSKDDEQSVIDWLKPRFEHLMKLWHPIEMQPVSD